MGILIRMPEYKPVRVQWIDDDLGVKAEHNVFLDVTPITPDEEEAAQQRLESAHEYVTKREVARKGFRQAPQGKQGKQVVETISRFDNEKLHGMQDETLRKHVVGWAGFIDPDTEVEIPFSTDRFMGMAKALPPLREFALGAIDEATGTAIKGAVGFLGAQEEEKN